MRTLVEKTPLFRRLSSPCTLALVDLLVPLVVLPREYVLVQVKAYTILITRIQAHPTLALPLRTTLAHHRSAACVDTPVC
jgi:hypothetical protein